MYLCYIDESGTPDIPGNTSHYILAGLSIPVEHWKTCDKEIEKVKSKYGLLNSEIHVAWILRSYPEQKKVENFEKLQYGQRRAQVTAFRTAELLRLQRVGNGKLYRQTQKNFKQTESYIHLTREERRKLIGEMAYVVSKWGFARLFAECINKIHFKPTAVSKSIDEQAFEQVVSRFEHYLQVTNQKTPNKVGLLIHDNNETVAKKHTAMMNKFHKTGTLWTSLKHIIETPLFVDSELTAMIQVADLCSYALRRYLENGEADLFETIFKRADRKDDIAVGVRHFSDRKCTCKICIAHTKTASK